MEETDKHTGGLAFWENNHQDKGSYLELVLKGIITILPGPTLRTTAGCKGEMCGTVFSRCWLLPRQEAIPKRGLTAVLL
jgi:hypothetical protein